MLNQITPCIDVIIDKAAILIFKFLNSPFSMPFCIIFENKVIIIDDIMVTVGPIMEYTPLAGDSNDNIFIGNDLNVGGYITTDNIGLKYKRITGTTAMARNPSISGL